MRRTKIKWSPKWSPTIGNGEGNDGSRWNSKLKFVNEIKLGGMRTNREGWPEPNFKTGALNHSATLPSP
jgi:hypothetical protein